MSTSLCSVYGLLIQTEIPLPGLSAATGEPEVRILLETISGPSIEIEGIARFLVRDGREILVEPAPGADPEALAYLVRTTALGALLAQRGCLVLHAAAVDLPEGAVLFVGPSAIGKSTVAAAMIEHGHPLLSDDFTALEVRDGELWALPSSPEIRVWKSSRRAASWTQEARRVRAIFLLPEAASNSLEIAPLSEEDAFLEVAAGIYRWRFLAALGLPIEPILQAVTLLVRGSPSFALSRPRDLSRLSEVSGKVATHVARLPPRRRRHWSLTIPFPPLRFGEVVPASLPDSKAGFVLVTSYPKSGNTWVRALLTAWRLGDNPLLSDLDGVASYRQRHEFAEVLGIDSSFFSLDELTHWRGRLFVDRARLPTGSAPTKVHDRYDARLFPPEAVVGMIYIVRNPLDVAVSLAHHLQVSLDAAVAMLNSRDSYLWKDRREVDGSAAAPLFPQHVSSWSDHVLSWIDLPGCLVVRYEDLLANPLQELKRMVEFLGLDWDEARAGKVVQLCDFKSLQRQERSLGFKEKPAEAPPFFRKGVAGDWRKDLPPALARAILTTHAEVMARLAYTSEG